MRDENRLKTIWQCNDLTFTSQSHIVLENIVAYSLSAIQICFIVRFPYIARKEFSKEIFFCQIKNEEEAKKSRLYHTIACQFITMLTY